MKEKIINYLLEKYHPRCLMVYGSYCRGDYEESSDFDALLIVDEKKDDHDHSIVEGVQLDCFLYTAEEVLDPEKTETFLAAYKAELIVDDGIGQELKERVLEYAKTHAVTEPKEKDFMLSWYRKTLKRIRKGDDEGNYRAIWMLEESLPDYFVLRDIFFTGSKEGIAYLKKEDPQGYDLFHAAFSSPTTDHIEEWIKHVTDISSPDSGVGCLLDKEMEALSEAQKEFAGEAERAGLKDDEDVMAMIKDIRKSAN